MAAAVRPMTIRFADTMPPELIPERGLIFPRGSIPLSAASLWYGFDFEQALSRHDGIVAAAGVEVLVHRAELGERGYRDRGLEPGATLARSNDDHSHVAGRRLLGCHLQGTLAD